MTYISLENAFNELGKLFFPEEWDGDESRHYNTYRLVCKDDKIVGLSLNTLGFTKSWIARDEIERHYLFEEESTIDSMLIAYHESSGGISGLIKKYKELHGKFIGSIKNVKYKDDLEFQNKKKRQIKKYNEIISLCQLLLSHKTLLNENNTKYRNKEKLIKFITCRSKKLIQDIEDDKIKKGMTTKQYHSEVVSIAMKIAFYDVGCVAHEEELRKNLPTIIAGILRAECIITCFLVTENLKYYRIEAGKIREVSIKISTHEKDSPNSSFLFKDNVFISSSDFEDIKLKNNLSIIDIKKRPWLEFIEHIKQNVDFEEYNKCTNNQKRVGLLDKQYKTYKNDGFFKLYNKKFINNKISVPNTLSTNGKNLNKIPSAIIKIIDPENKVMDIINDLVKELDNEEYFKHSKELNDVEEKVQNFFKAKRCYYKGNKDLVKIIAKLIFPLSN